MELVRKESTPMKGCHANDNSFIPGKVSAKLMIEYREYAYHKEIGHKTMPPPITTACKEIEEQRADILTDLTLIPEYFALHKLRAIGKACCAQLRVIKFRCSIKKSSSKFAGSMRGRPRIRVKTYHSIRLFYFYVAPSQKDLTPLSNRNHSLIL